MQILGLRENATGRATLSWECKHQLSLISLSLSSYETSLFSYDKNYACVSETRKNLMNKDQDETWLEEIAETY